MGEHCVHSGGESEVPEEILSLTDVRGPPDGSLGDSRVN